MSAPKQMPPKFLLRFFRWYCNPGLADHIEGDLLEVYTERLGLFGKRVADVKFALDVLLLFRPGIIRSIKTEGRLNTYPMYKSYFKTGWRHLTRDKLYSAIKVVGLSIGLSVCMLIFLYTKDEVTYDRFHANKARIFRILQDWKFGADAPRTIGITNAIMGEEFARAIPEVEQLVRVSDVDVSLKKDEEVFHEKLMAVDASFFSVFTFDLVEGDRKTALNDMHSIILSKENARKYFGTENALGKTMEIIVNGEVKLLTVTGISDRSPQNSTLKTDMLIPFRFYELYINNNKGWLGGSMTTFLMLAPQASAQSVVAKMQNIFDSHTKDELAKQKEAHGLELKIALGLQPLADIHLSQRVYPTESNPLYSYLLTGIAIFILAIACINFVNLAIAQSMKRAREIGVRKVVGSTRKQLVRQFLTESFVVSCVSFGIAVLLSLAVIPFFNDLANKELSFSYLADGYLLGAFLVLLVIASLVAGFYPAIVLSSFQPTHVLYGRSKVLRRNFLTRGLIVVQFSISIFLIIGTIAVNSQLDFLFNADLGYNNENLVRVEIPISGTSERLPGMFKASLVGKPNIVGVAARNGGRSITRAKVDGRLIDIESVKIDDRFLSTFDIPIIAGRNVSPDRPSDSLNAVIVNESFVREAGWTPDQAVGKQIQLQEDVTIIGVIRNYHFLSLKEDIKPQVLSMNPFFNFGEIWIRINPEDVPSTLALIRSTFHTLVPLFPYSYQFMDDINAENYKVETKWKQIITIASLLFIFISCMGLFGLVGLSVEHRTKEIGIRKVLGAAVSVIVNLVSREFVLLVAFAFLIAAPAAWYAINTWLATFAYRIDPALWMFSLGGAIVMIMALGVVCMQALKAAWTNPVNSLKTE